MYLYTKYDIVYIVYSTGLSGRASKRERARERGCIHTHLMSQPWFISSSLISIIYVREHILFTRTHLTCKRTHYMYTYTPYVTAKVSLLVVDFDERHPRLYHRPWIHLFVHSLHALTHTHTTHTQTHTHTHMYTYIVGGSTLRCGSGGVPC